MLIATRRTRDSLWLGAGIFGFTVGNLLMLQPLMLAQAFGVMDYPKIFSFSQAVTTVGVARRSGVARHDLRSRRLSGGIFGLCGTLWRRVRADRRAGPIPEAESAQ